MNYRFTMLLLVSAMAPVAIQSNTQPNSVLTANNAAIADLEPQVLWHYFAEISQIPRGSYKEAAIAQYVMDEAIKHGCTAHKDAVGNVIVSKPASSALYKDVPIVVIQCHLDMVCEKNKHVVHDFEKDPITFVRKDYFLYADGTTLGADNGIGVAAALAIMQADNLVHGPLELLFTVVEEAGFDGAIAVNAHTIQGRKLINVDAEEDGSVYIGCAGSGCVLANMRSTREKLDESYVTFAVVVDGLRGGHSGVDIDQNRGNALKIAGQVLAALQKQKINFKLISIDGGNKRNAIARDVEILLAFPGHAIEQLKNACVAIEDVIKKQYGQVEQKMTITVMPRVCEKNAISAQDQVRIIDLIQAMPHGVIAMSKFINNLVETSTNFARIKTDENMICFETMQRSLVGQELDGIAQKVHKVCEAHGCNATIEDGSPEWQPNEHSAMLQVAQATYKRIFGKDVQVKAIHAGLECGAFVRQVPGLDAISFGPTIYDAHSPSEHIDARTVKPFWIYLTGMLADVALNS